MLAIDTNVVVRYLTGDHAAQSRKAKALIDGSDVFISLTVLLETEWVLRSVYDFAPGRLALALRAFAGLPRVTVEEPQLAAEALDLAEKGIDFADALHLCKAKGCDAFVTFDARFARNANALSDTSVRTL